MPAFTPHQDAALSVASAWLKTRRGGSSIFRLFGYAGTGKTTLAKHIAEGVDGKVLFAAYTGKAAGVMRSKGCHGASTIHSLITSRSQTTRRRRASSSGAPRRPPRPD